LADDVGDLARVAADYSDLAGHRLDQDAAKLLLPLRNGLRGQHEYRGAPDEVGHLDRGAGAKQLDALRDAKLVCQGEKLGALWAIADNLAAPFARQPRE